MNKTNKKVRGGLLQVLVLSNKHYFSGCPSIVPGASAGVIYSPNFPWNYPYSISCDWNITAPWSKMIKLQFTKFYVGSSYGYCYTDYVEVRNSYGYRIAKYCGSSIPSSVTLSGSMRVRFHSDYSSVYSGFMAFYQTGYSFPTETPYPPRPTYPPYHRTTYPYHWNTNPPVYSPSAQSIYTCNPYYQTSKLSSFHYVL